ncbi:hypothetical protein DF281_10060 [Kurthia zopfii]|nr:hypothetical protein DF281_10060 [Kurthia zopfii]
MSHFKNSDKSGGAFTFSSNLAVPSHMIERFTLFVLCLAPNAICFQLFKFSGKSGGAFTFPSNSPDLPHMGERFTLFVLCLAPVAYLFESLRKLGEKWWGAYFSFVSSSALEINEPPPLFV